MTRLHTFSRASRRLRVFAPSFDWFTGLSVAFVIGQSDLISLVLGLQVKTIFCLYQLII